MLTLETPWLNVPASRRSRKDVRGDGEVVDGHFRLKTARKLRPMVTDPPYGIELDAEWRDDAGLHGKGAAEPSDMKHRTAGHSETLISGDTRAD